MKPMMKQLILPSLMLCFAAPARTEEPVPLTPDFTAVVVKGIAALGRMGAVTPEVFDKMIDVIVRDYFGRPEYWRINGRCYYLEPEEQTGNGYLEATRDVFVLKHPRTPARLFFQ